MTFTRTRLAVLWAVFLAAHVLVAWLGGVLPNQPMGDVYLVYEPWAHAALTGGTVVGITEAWVYPQLALVPMMLAQLLAWAIAPLAGANAYVVAWALLVTLLDVIAFAVLTGRRPTQPRRVAAWFWCGALLALGPIAIYRIDAITVPSRSSRVCGSRSAPPSRRCCWRWGVDQDLAGALLAASVLAAKPRLRLLAAGAITVAAIPVVLFLLGADAALFGFLTAQTDRGLQIEAVAATPFLWLALAGRAGIDYSFEILTFQITAPGAALVAALTLPALMLGVGVLLLLGGVAAARGASYRTLFPPLALALVLALIVLNKVGSPQFLTWLFVPVMLWIVLDRARAVVPAILTLVLCALTFAVYPVLYGGLLAAEALPIVVLSVRNGLLLVLLALSVTRLVRVLRHPRARH
ncbi:hypothetical protein [Microbacterium sp. NIBRBAC000506063]|uniref:hypothetical protein n=1 Tax=Microbacterium sp. NIBRBAC000506063 TaxID=2734618 RepID=UPI001CB6F724|nr:hypothetical protein [Microbacterium sp. NIBRBAC000506063]